MKHYIDRVDLKRSLFASLDYYKQNNKQRNEENKFQSQELSALFRLRAGRDERQYIIGSISNYYI